MPGSAISSEPYDLVWRFAVLQGFSNDGVEQHVRILALDRPFLPDRTNYETTSLLLLMDRAL
jgi:hypothetical protein